MKLIAITEHSNAVQCVAFSPDGKLIASASWNDTVRLWSVPSGELNAELKGHTHWVLSVAFSPDGKSIVTGSGDNTVRTWSVATKQQLKMLDGHSDWVRSVAWSSNGDLIASGSWDKTVILWDANSGSVNKILTGHKKWVVSVSFSQNGNKLASAGWDNTAIIWDVNSGAILIKLTHDKEVFCVCFSYDNNFVFTGSDDAIIRMFNAKTGHEEKRFEGHTDHVNSISASFDRSMIASGSSDSSVRLWDVESTMQLEKLHDHANSVQSVVFSRDGKFVASGGFDSTMRLWNVQSLQISCFYNDIDEVQSQLDNGANMNLKGPYGFTPLHYAIDQQHIQVVQLLLERGADIGIIKDDKYRDAFGFALDSDNSTIVSLLEQAANLQQQELKSILESTLQQTKPFTLRLDKNHLGLYTWHNLTCSNVCKQFLVGLYLEDNKSLGAVPADFAQLGALKHLSVFRCGLSLSDIRGIAGCVNLLSLDLSYNELGDLPDEFGEMNQLSRLNLTFCNLSFVPSAILRMKSLCDLNMTYNALHGLPVDLGYLPLLATLTLRGCPLTTIPIEYRTKTTPQLLRFLRDSEQSSTVYRSKLLVVGYGEVGKTTLLTNFFPIKMNNLLPELLATILSSEFAIQQAERLIQRKEGARAFDKTRRHYVYERNEIIQHNEEEDDDDENYIENDVWLRQRSHSNAIMNIGSAWNAQLEHSNVTTVDKFRCKDRIEPDPRGTAAWHREMKSRTDGISVVQTAITSEELNSALNAVAPTTPNLSLFEYDPQNKVPEKESLELSYWDFAGQYEYQDGHQLFLMSRAVYLVLWDVTPSKRKQELAKLRHWLITLQLHLGTTDNNMRSSVLVYIVGTHVDSDDDFLLEPCLEQVQQVLIECNFTLPHRIVDPMDTRNQNYVNKLKNQLFADVAVQSHLGELVPKGYLQIEQYLLDQHHEYRVNTLLRGADAAIPIIRRQFLVERWQRGIPYVTRALELFNRWGGIVYFGKDSKKQQHILLDELVVYAPEWLTVSVLGSIVQLMRQQKDKLKKNNSSSGHEPIVLHRDLIKLSSVWQNIPSHLHDHVMEMLYSLDLGFSVSPTSDGQSKPFAERSSFFPQLLPFLPPRSLTWQANASTSEAVYIIKLNGFAMGFHGVLFTRLQSLFKSAEYASCWQCGFLFSDASQSVLVILHDDTQQIRICIRNSSNPFKVFIDIKVIVASLIDERYRGVQKIGEFIECPCEDCKSVKWRWNSKIYDQVYNDSNIQSLCKDTTSRADLAIAMGHHNQPDGSPHLFNIEEIMNAKENLICKKTYNTVLVSSLKHLTEEPVPSIPVSATFPARIALVVGNDKYVQRDQLNHGVLDAASVRKRLRELEFETIAVFDGAKDEIDKAIEKYKSAVSALAEVGTEPGVLSIIYLSGHAYQKDGVNFYVSSDEQPIKLQDLVTQIKSICKQNSHLAFPVCVILDACRTGKDAFVFQELKTDLDYLFVYSCRSGQRAFDGFLQDEHSPFATAVLRHLQRGRSLHDICADIIIDTNGSGQQPMFVNSCRKRVIL